MKITELERLRCRAGLTQTELSEASGISRDTISRTETEQRTRAHATTTRKLAAALGVEICELAGLDPEGLGNHKPGEHDITSNHDAVAKRIELFEIGKELADKRLDLVLDLARELAAASPTEEIKP